MLENLDTIEWGNLQHAYGDASDVPDLIRALASDNEDERKNAYWKLHGNIVHQGSVYEAAAYAVPFFIELLKHDNISDKGSLLGLLSTLAQGGSWHESHQYVDWLFKNERDTPEFQEKVSVEVSYVKATYEAVIKDYELYLTFLSHEDSQVRYEAVELLSNCGRFTDVIEPHLRQSILNEPKFALRPTYLLALKYLWLHPDYRIWQDDLTGEQKSYFLDLFRNSEHISLRYGAALALANLADEKLAVELLGLFEKIAWMDFEEQQEIGFSFFEIQQNLRNHHPQLTYEFFRKVARHPEPIVRQESISALEYFGVNYRPAVEEVISILVDMIKSEHEELTGLIHERVARTLSMMGLYARPYLVDLKNILDVGGRSSKFALQDVIENRWTLDALLNRQEILDEPVDDLVQSLIDISQLETLKERSKFAKRIKNIIYTLEQRGEPISDAVAPMLKIIDTYNDYWTPIFAARAIYAIDPSQHELVFNVLMRELRPGPPSVIVVDSLRKMGKYADSALDILRKIAQHDYRFMRFSHSSTINADEALQVEVKKAIQAIESASND